MKLNRSAGKSQQTKETVKLNKKASKGVTIGKRTLSLILSGVIVLSCFGICIALLNKQSAKVLVARITTDVGPGTRIKEDILEPFEMVFENYESEGVVTYKDNKGESVTENIFIRWEDRTKYIDQFMKLPVQAGAILSTRQVTPELLLKSPWIEKLQDGMELYTMTFGSKDIYQPILYPGTHLRVRMTYDVPVSDAPNIKALIAEKERKKQSGQYVANGESVIIETLQNSGYMEGVGFGEMTVKTVPISEVVFEDIVVVDMLNNGNESIFDLYTELLGLPIDKRVEYLKTQIEGQGSNSFKQKVTPTQLTYVVTKAEATSLAEFEALGATLKYTILPQGSTDYSLMSQFTEIGNQVQSFIDNANVHSFN